MFILFFYFKSKELLDLYLEGDSEEVKIKLVGGIDFCYLVFKGVLGILVLIVIFVYFV